MPSTWDLEKNFKKFYFNMYIQSIAEFEFPGSLLNYLLKKYNEKDYPKYDNYDAIEVSKTKDIPIDYKWIMWVPITFLNKYNPEQFEIVWCNRDVWQDAKWTYGKSSFINGKETFKRIFIKNKKI